MIRTAIALLFPLSLLSSVLSPDAQALAKKSHLFGTEQSRAQRSSGANISGMLVVTSDFDESAFTSLGGTIISRSPSVFTISIPADSLNRLESIAGISQFSPSRKVFPAMEKALTAGHAVDVYNGTSFANKTGYTGKGVIIGVIDNGFDYIHPAFRETSGKLRLSRVWDQNATGTPPSGYLYGAAYTTESAIRQKELDNVPSTGHGTHVAGIAGGSWNLPAPGVAPGSELVFVSTNMVDNGIVDGIRWIFDYATSVGKPAVVNLSLGLHYGPHDGSSAVDRVFEAYAGEGRIIVGAAGNERLDKCHISANLNGVDTIRTAISIPTYDNTGYQLLSIWGEPGQNFSVGFELYENGVLKSKTPIYSVTQIQNANGVANTLNYSGGTINNELFGEVRSPLNGKANLGIALTSPTALAPGNPVEPVMVLTGARGKVHAWASFETSEKYPGFHKGTRNFSAGDTSYSIGEIGGTGRATISVGAYTSKTSFVNVDNNTVAAMGSYFNSADSLVSHKGYGEEEIAQFSSVGPTPDGRIKPDITAPGNVIISAFRRGISGPDDSYWEQQTSHNVTDGLRKFPYGGIQGTSMASPFVAGTVALMLEADPTLTPAEVKTILQSTAIADTFTGTIPVGGSISWGAGKIDVDAAVRMAESKRSVPHLRTESVVKVTMGNSFSGTTELTLSGIYRETTLRLYDFRGRELLHKSIPSTSSGVVPVQIKGVASGNYIYQISNASIEMTGKINIKQ